MYLCVYVGVNGHLSALQLLDLVLCVLSLTSAIIRCSGCETLQSLWIRPSTATFSAFLVPPAADHFATTTFVCGDVCGAWHYPLIKLHAGDVWRTIIGYCTRIKDSQVQAGSIIIIIIIHVSQKISYLTEVIHTPFEWVLLLFQCCLLGRCSGPFVLCQTSH